MTYGSAVSRAIADNLRALRTSQGWSIDALASRAGISRGMVIRIEQARTNPSIGTLVRLADALRVSVATLVEVAEPTAVRVIPAGERVTLWSSASGSVAQLLAGTDSAPLVELWHWRLADLERYRSEAHPPGTIEMITVTSGRLVIELGGEEYVCAPGDTAVFVADRQHAYCGAAESEATTFLMVVRQPSVVQTMG